MTTTLAVMTQFISRVLDKSGQVAAVYLDIRKAFDFIDHQILLQKMAASGFSDNNQSRACLVKSGVPQGSNLGLLLFIIFFRDIPELQTSNILMFADDIKIFTKIDSLSTEKCKVIRER